MAARMNQVKLPTLTTQAGQLRKTLAFGFFDKSTAYSAAILYMNLWWQAVCTSVLDYWIALYFVVCCWDQCTSKRIYSQLRNPK